MMRNSQRALLIGWLLVAAGASTAAASKPYLLHLNGIGGRRNCDLNLIRGLTLGGLDAEVEFYDWTGDDVGIGALQARQRHQAEARRIADNLIARFRADPKSPIYITSHSAGCGLAVWALELLPDDVMIEQLAMFAPALSPNYDLSKALRHVRRHAYVFTSRFDQVVLGAGTKLFGTIDGQHVEAAGLKGFTQPDGADAEQYRKLVSYAYKPGWLARYGNDGGHIGALRVGFARDYVATLLLTGSPPAEPDARLAIQSPPATQPSEPIAPLP